MTKPTASKKAEYHLPPPSGGGTHGPSVSPPEGPAAAEGSVVPHAARSPDGVAVGSDSDQEQPSAFLTQSLATEFAVPAPTVPARIGDVAAGDKESLAAEIEIVVSEALAEDIGAGDLTTEATVEGDAICTADLVVKEPGVLCGLQVAEATFVALDSELRFEEIAQDGTRLSAPWTVTAAITGSARALLSAERTALNLLGRLSGIATLTRSYVDAIDGTGAVILDTRKTTPGLRALEKYAVRCGGGQNHRFGLFDAVLIKENHIRLAGGLAVAVERVRRQTLDAWIEVEVEELAELELALDLGVDRVMLDNMPLDAMAEAAAFANGEVELEASGGVTLENVRAVAETGVDFISVGALTHSAGSLDVSLEVQ